MLDSKASKQASDLNSNRKNSSRLDGVINYLQENSLFLVPISRLLLLRGKKREI